MAGGSEACGGAEHAVVANDKYCCLEPGAGHHDSSRLMAQTTLINSRQHRGERERNPTDRRLRNGSGRGLEEGGGNGKKRETSGGKLDACCECRSDFMHILTNVSTFIRGANNLSLGAAVPLWGFNVQ